MNDDVFVKSAGRNTREGEMMSPNQRASHTPSSCPDWAGTEVRLETQAALLYGMPTETTDYQAL